MNNSLFPEEKPVPSSLPKKEAPLARRVAPKSLDEILGQKCYAALKDLPVKPDAVDIVVPPKVGEQILRECAELGIQNVWLQPGADTQPVIDLAKELGLTVVDHACIMVELRKMEA